MYLKLKGEIEKLKVHLIISPFDEKFYDKYIVL